MSVAASFRDRTPSFVNDEERWLFTVLSERWSVAGDLPVRHPEDDEAEHLLLAAREHRWRERRAERRGEREQAPACAAHRQAERSVDVVAEHEGVDPFAEELAEPAQVQRWRDEDERCIREPSRARSAQRRPGSDRGSGCAARRLPTAPASGSASFSADDARATTDIPSASSELDDAACGAAGGDDGDLGRFRRCRARRGSRAVSHVDSLCSLVKWSVLRCMILHI